jgi:hypothetical protein
MSAVKGLIMRAVTKAVCGRFNQALFTGVMVLILGLGVRAAFAAETVGQSADQQPRVLPWVADVVKMSDSGVAPEVIETYVKNTSARSNLGVDDILYLKAHGISNGIMTAMIQHGGTAPSSGVPASFAPGPYPQPAPAPEPTPQDYYPATVPVDYPLQAPVSVYYYGSSYPNYYPYYSYPGFYYPFGFYFGSRFGFRHDGFSRGGFHHFGGSGFRGGGGFHNFGSQRAGFGGGFHSFGSQRAGFGGGFHSSGSGRMAMGSGGFHGGRR